MNIHTGNCWYKEFTWWKGHCHYDHPINKYSNAPSLMRQHSYCMVQNDPSLLNEKDCIKLREGILDLANSPYEIGLFVYGFETFNRLKSLLLILCLWEIFD